MDDTPALGKPAQHQRENPRWRVVLELQAKSAADEDMTVAEQLDRQLVEREFAHFLAVGLIALAVAIERRLPAGRLLVAGEKAQFLRLPVAGHEAFQIALVPGDDLVVEDLSHRGLVLRGLAATDSRGGEQNRHQQPRHALHEMHSIILQAAG